MTEYFGSGKLGKLKYILKQEQPQRILLVTGTSAYADEIVRSQLDSLFVGYDYTRLTCFTSNPCLEDVAHGVQMIKDGDYDFVVGMGGGVVLDGTKAISLLSQQPTDNLEGYIRKEEPITHPALRKVLIPTTAGTGSEATHFAVVYIHGIKFSLAHPSLILEHSIIDPTLTLSLPPYVTACTGFDAFSQAIESFWSINSTEESQKYSAQAIELALKNLERAVHSPTPRDRKSMCEASNLAGKAINIAKTTAAHAVSYPITSFFHVPHGHAVALTLPSFLEYNARVDEKNVQDERGVVYVQRMMTHLFRLLGVSNGQEGKKKIESLMDSIGLNRTLSSCGVTSRGQIGFIIQEGFNPERVINNPRTLTQSSLKDMLEALF